MTKGRWITEKPKEICRGDGVTEIVMVKEPDIQVFPFGRRELPKRKRKKKWQEVMIVATPTALFAGGISFLRELMVWHEGVLWIPYWTVTFVIAGIILYANLTKKRTDSAVH